MGEMTKVEGRLGWNAQEGRYGLLVSDLWQKTGYHCGDRLKVMVEGVWVDTRMEMTPDREWYLVGTPYRGDLEYIRVQAEVWEDD
jgi:hypothetical protein